MFRPRVIALLLVLITLLAYLPALEGEFLGFDDRSYISENDHIQNGITIGSLKWAYTSFYASNWHPLTWITCMVSYELFRLNPAGYHFVNILFHCANTGLLFVLLLWLTEELWPSAFVAALFAWHPLHVESVAWIAEVKDVSSTFWGLLALLAYVRYARKFPDVAEPSKTDENRLKNDATALPSVPVPDTLRLPDGHLQLQPTRHPARFYWLSLGLFALSLMCKSMLVTLPFVLLLLDYWPLRRWQKPGRCLWEKIPFFVLAAVVSLLTVLAQKNTAMASFSAVPLQLRLENVVMAYAGYLWKAVWPANLVILYPLPDTVSQVKLGLCLLFLVMISVTALACARRQPWLPVGWLWYLGTLVPVIGLVQVGSQSMADRYTYFPLIGIFFAVTLSVAAIMRYFHIPRILLVAPAILLLAACLMRTEYQLRYWRDTQTLFAHAVETTTHNPLAHLVLGKAYEQNHQLELALKQYQEALKLSNGMSEIYQNIGHLLGIKGQNEAALKYYEMALKLNPRSAVLHDSIGTLYIQLKRYPEAEKEFAAAIRLDPNYAPAHFRMGWTLLRKNQGTDAVKQFREAIRLDPKNLGVLLYVAQVMAASDNPQARNGAEACRLARQAEQLPEGNQPGVLDALAAAYAECGRFDEAVATEQQALDLARQMNLTGNKSDMEARLELYRQHQPWRKSFDIP